MPTRNANYCPLLRKPCIEHKCAWYTHMQGMNPQTGQPVDEWKCALVWLPLLLVENASMVRQNKAAVESFRNEMLKPSPLLQRVGELMEEGLRRTQLLNADAPSRHSLPDNGS